MSRIDDNTAVSQVLGVLLLVAVVIVLSSLMVYYMLSYGEMAGTKATIATILKH